MEPSRSPSLTPVHGKLLLLHDAVIGLNEVLAGDVLSEEELDQVLTEPPP